MKKIYASLLTAAMVTSLLAGCGSSTAPATTEAPAAETTETTEVAVDATSGENVTEADDVTTGGKVFNIYAWNEEFKGFFEKYYTAQVPYKDDEYFEAAPGKHWIDEGYTFNWVINPSDNGVYQEKLDEALLNQANADADAKVDLFLAEADYITKYADSDYTAGIDALGTVDQSQIYGYTALAAADSNGIVKGCSFQCCPSALIYRRSLAKTLLGTDDPAEVQAKLGSWDDFMTVAEDVASKGYLMTPSFAEDFRVFSNNCTSAWVAEDGTLTIPTEVYGWIEQTKKLADINATKNAGVWDDAKNAEMNADGKALCFFGPAWYFNFCMGPAHEQAMGDWAICQGPQAHFWGGTWMLAANGTDNGDIVADIMNAFLANEDVIDALVAVEGQYPNNKAIADKYANDASYGSEFLGGQNDIAVFSGMTDSIKWENHTIYDQLLCEGIQNSLQDYFFGVIDEDTAWANFYTFINEKYPEIVTP